MADLAHAAGNDLDLLLDVDARHWAERFAARAHSTPAIATDESTMTTWFASAIEAGRAAGRAEAKKPAPHGVLHWAQATGPGTWRSMCACGQEYENLVRQRANAALQLHITGKVAGHGPGAPRHSVRSWSMPWRDENDWRALCSCGHEVADVVRAGADERLLLHFEEANADGQRAA